MGDDMASKNVIGMMISKGAPFSIEQIEMMSDSECWKWVYKNFPPKPHDGRPQICFTGFKPEERKKVEDIAIKAGYRVVKSVTVRLSVLVMGEVPGPSKLKKAKGQGAKIISQKEFIANLLLES